MNTLTENQITDIAIRITDKLVEMGYVPNCIDTDDNYEFDVQDMVSETISESLNKLTLNLELYHAKCDECSTPINEGYVLYGGEHYYCSDKCLHTKLTPEEWDRLNELDFDCYWTDWNEEDANYKLVNGELIEL